MEGLLRFDRRENGADAPEHSQCAGATARTVGGYHVSLTMTAMLAPQQEDILRAQRRVAAAEARAAAAEARAARSEAALASAVARAVCAQAVRVHQYDPARKQWVCVKGEPPAE